MKSSRAGFTLIELMVTLAILAIAMMVAVPSMLDFQRNAELTSAVNSLTAAINAAKGEAMKRNMRAIVRPASNNLWSSGYIVFIDANRDDTLNTGERIVLDETNVPVNLEITGTGAAGGSSPRIRFDGSGYALDATAAAPVAVTLRRRDTVGKPEEYAQTRHVTIAQTGRVRSCKPKSATDLDCAATLP